MSEFRGFPKGTLRFLRDVSRNNDRAWFEDHREAYERFYLAPAQAFVAQIGPRLEALAQGVRAEPAVNRSIRRIHRDTRFSQDKRPFKDHLDLFFRVGDGQGDPGFFLRLTARNWTLGAGVLRFDKDALATYREHVVDDARGRALTRLTTRLRHAGFDVGGARYKRAPRGYEPEHPRAALLLHDALHAFREAAHGPVVHDAGFVSECVRHFRKTAPLLEWLAALR
jgi:uncharacterized protein (TIGR02453 family)